jgi:hypothetical protein
MTAHGSPPYEFTLDRRRLLQLGTVTTTAALGGCFGFGATDYPTYTEWVPSQDTGLTLAYVDFRIAEESQKANQLLPLLLPSRDTISGSETVPELQGLNAIDDPFLVWPLDTWRRLLAGMGIGLGGGLGYLVDPERPAETVDELFVVDDVAVATGEFDAERADETLRSGPDNSPGDIAHETVGEQGTFTLYESTREELDTVIAVSETAVVLGDTRDAVQTVIETWQGDHDRAVADAGPFGRLIDAAGDGDFVAGWTGPVNLDERTVGDPAARLSGDPLSEREHVISSISFTPNTDEITAKLAVEDAGLTETTRDRITSQLGTSAEEMSVNRRGDGLSATATYPADALDLTFSPPETTDRNDETNESVPPEGDTPPEVADAVPDGALNFSYNADRHRVAVTLETNLTIDKLTLRAVQRDYETWTTSPSTNSDLGIGVDPDGDVVIVTATVDGVSGEVARRTVP